MKLSRPFSIIFLAILVASCVVSAAHGSDEPPVPVRTAKVFRRDVAAGKVFIGSVLPARRSVVGSAVAGRVEKVFVEEGDLVEAAEDGSSDKLVQLRLNTVQIELAAAQADLEISQHELAELVNGPREEDLLRLEAQLKGAEAVQEFARGKFDRIETLFKRDATAQGNLDEVLSAKRAAEQNYIAAKAEHEAAVRGTRSEQLAQARARLSKAEEEVNRLRDRLDNHTIHTPFRGYVVARHTEKGAWIQQGDPIAEIAQLDPVEIRTAVPEEYISRVHQGMTVRVDVEAIQSDTNKLGVLTGTIFRVVPSADARSRSFPVRIRVENPALDGLPLLKPGMLAKVVLPVGRSTAALLVSKDALVLDRKKAAVFVVENPSDKPTVRKVEVELGSAQDLVVEVRPINDVLAVGMHVVVEGNERLQTDQRVKVIP